MSVITHHAVIGFLKQAEAANSRRSDNFYI